MTNEDKIVNTLLQRNTTHLSMSGDTPFARGDLADDIGRDGEGKGAEEMLRETYTMDNEGMDLMMASTEMNSFLKALKLPNSKLTGGIIPTMSSLITLQQYNAIFNSTRKQTISSPLGLHYGHYKAACEDDSLSQVHLLFMTVPFQVGIPLSRWKNSLHCMI